MSVESKLDKLNAQYSEMEELLNQNIYGYIENMYGTYSRFRKRFGLGTGWAHIFNGPAVPKYLTICKSLGLDPFDGTPLNTYRENRKEYILENMLTSKYCDLTAEGRKRVMEYLNDIWETEKYRRV